MAHLKLKSPFIALLCTCILAAFYAPAQTDTGDNVSVHIDNSRNIEHFETDTGKFTKFIDNVVLRQGTDTLYCDSAVENETTHNFEAFSNVKIAQQGGTRGASDYLKYTSSQKLAYMRGNVSLTDGKNNLVCEELTYNLGTKTAVYDNWGTLHNDSTTVTSKTGVYNINDKNARFQGDVLITDPQYKIKSEDLLYNTESKITQFFSKSVITNEKGRGILQTSNGFYDGKQGKADFYGRSSIWNEDQYIEADTLNYSKSNGHGVAIGRVISLDTQHHSIMYCGFAEYYRKQRKTFATIKPVLVQVNGKDTFYMRADTFISAPMVKSKMRNPNSLMPADTVGYPHPAKDTATAMLPDQKTKPKKDATNWVVGSAARKKKGSSPGHTRNEGKPPKGGSETASAGISMNIFGDADTTQADTTAPLYFIGFHHVLLFSDSMQGKCDSICYTRSDSMIRMMYNPAVWSHRSQITGDTILLQMDSSELRRMYVPNNAFLVSRSGPEKAHLFNQIQGKTLMAYFVKNTISRMVVFPDAQCIYFAQDEKGAYLGLDNSTGTRMRVNFEDQKIKTIVFVDDYHTKMTPMTQADLDGAKLSRFKWRDDERPRTKEDLFK